MDSTFDRFVNIKGGNQLNIKKILISLVIVILIFAVIVIIYFAVKHHG